MHYTDNYSWLDWLKDGFAEDGDVFEGANLSQAVPGTTIGLKAPVGTGLETCATPAKGLIFRRCNLFNCLPPEDAVVEDCNTAQVEYCSHLHPELAERGLKACGEDCPHRASGERVWQPTHETEFREAKADLAKATAVRLIKVLDNLGVVTEQRFEKLAPVHVDTILPKWRPAKDAQRSVGGKP